MHAHQANQAHVNIGVLVQTSTPRGQRVRALWCAWMCYCRRVAGAHAPAVCAHEAVAPGCHCRHSTGAVRTLDCLLRRTSYFCSAKGSRCTHIKRRHYSMNAVPCATTAQDARHDDEHGEQVDEHGQVPRELRFLMHALLLTCIC